MEIHDTELPRGHGESIGHGHDGDFLQAEDVSKAAIANKGVIERHFGCAGIAEDMPHAEAGKEIEEGVDSSGSHATIVVNPTWTRPGDERRGNSRVPQRARAVERGRNRSGGGGDRLPGAVAIRSTAALGTRELDAGHKLGRELVRESWNSWGVDGTLRFDGLSV